MPVFDHEVAAMDFSFRLRNVTCKSVLSTEDSDWGRQDGIRLVLLAYTANGYHDFRISGRELPEPDLVDNYPFVPGKTLNLDLFPPVKRPDWTLDPVPFGEPADVVRIAVVGINEGLPFVGGGGGFSSVTHSGFEELTKQMAETAATGATAAVGIAVAFELLKAALEGMNGPDCRGVAFVYQTDLSLKKLLQDHLHNKSTRHVLGTANGNQALGIVSGVGVPAGCGKPSYEVSLQITREEPLSLEVQDHAGEPRQGNIERFEPSYEPCRPAELIFIIPTFHDREITFIPSFHYESLKPMWRVEGQELTKQQDELRLQVDVRRPGDEHMTTGQVTVKYRREEVGGIKRLILSTHGEDGDYTLTVGLFLNFEGNVPPPPSPFVEFESVVVPVVGHLVTGNRAYDQYLSCVEQHRKVFKKLFYPMPRLKITPEPEDPFAGLLQFQDVVPDLGRVIRGETPLDQLQAQVDAFEADRLVSQTAVVEGRHNLIARLINENHTEQAVSLVAETIAGYRQYARLAGADGMQVGRYLAELGILLSRAGRNAEAVDAFQALVDVYRSFTPEEADRLVYQISLVEGQHNLIARLIDESRTEEAVALVPETIAGYRQYARLAGADGMRAGRDLAELAILMAKPARRNREAVDALQALVDVYRAFTPEEADRLVYQISLVEGQHNLIARLIDESRTQEAVALVPETIAGYRQYARLAGADGMRASRNLAELAALMTRAGRNAEAEAAQQAADELRHDND
ncbi:hypothetical protein HRW14_31720 [Streptomyces lunaelactis]|uniref:hypothetical protein n=1 Tax=Streptomyces lunaelactis TaxID=1535768 RepID=UPI00158490DD|nr:hypothetical protein [Streptomyces lunaelactis]NUK54749.1 hypothetical protein [Streptomyces lunaelactis]NUK68456.1 hypothetical protein [Streptomyces lunaelactis]